MRWVVKKIERQLKDYKAKKDFRQKNFSEKQKKYLFEWNQKSKRKFGFFGKINNKKLENFRSIYTFINSKTWDLWMYFLIISCFLLISVSYVTFFSPYFKIQGNKIIIERLDVISNIEIASKTIIDKVEWQSIFALNTSELKKELISRQKNIKNIHISRLYPNWVKIILESYRPQFYTSFKSPINQELKTYLVTTNWILIPALDKWEKLPTLKIMNKEFEDLWFFDYKEWASYEDMQKIVKINTQFQKGFSWIKSVNLTYFKKEKEVHIQLESWIVLILELFDDYDKQLSYLKAYEQEIKAKEKREILDDNTIKYIDLRNPSKFFVCKEAKNCVKNLRRIYWEIYD